MPIPVELLICYNETGGEANSRELITLACVCIHVSVIPRDLYAGGGEE